MSELEREQKQVCFLAKIVALMMAIGTAYLLFRPE